MSNLTALSERGNQLDKVLKKRGPKPGTPNVAAKEAAERRKAERERIQEKYDLQEQKRARPIQVDQKGTLFAAFGLAGVALITSGVISFNGITSIAPLIGLSADWQAPMLFGFIEVLIVYFSIVYLVRRSRAKEAQGDFAGLITFSAAALLGNAYHTFDFHNWELGQADTYAGVLLSITAPIAVIWVTKSASGTLFAEAIRLDDK